MIRYISLLLFIGFVWGINGQAIAEFYLNNPENYKSESVEVTELEDGDNWYDRWRKDNL